MSVSGRSRVAVKAQIRGDGRASKTPVVCPISNARVRDRVQGQHRRRGRPGYRAWRGNRALVSGRVPCPERVRSALMC
jgi:hypothetical protein